MTITIIGSDNQRVTLENVGLDGYAPGSEGVDILYSVKREGGTCVEFADQDVETVVVSLKTPLREALK